MSATTACASCGTRNRVPTVATGMPVCGSCRSPLPWVVDATESDFDDAVRAPVPVLVDLWAPWCGPCRTLSPALEGLAARRAGRLKVVKVNVDEAPQLSARYQVRGIPMLLLFRDGALVDTQVGARPATAVADWIDGHQRPA